VVAPVALSASAANFALPIRLPQKFGASTLFSKDPSCHLI